ncbi:MAG TPA: hypothetical protein GXZ95_04580 [Mollicutes bacterium]|nr:hypothetical protein [Mollicutes bacterium]
MKNKKFTPFKTFCFIIAVSPIIYMLYKFIHIDFMWYKETSDLSLFKENLLIYGLLLFFAIISYLLIFSEGERKPTPEEIAKSEKFQKIGSGIVSIIVAMIGAFIIIYTVLNNLLVLLVPGILLLSGGIFMFVHYFLKGKKKINTITSRTITFWLIGGISSLIPLFFWLYVGELIWHFLIFTAFGITFIIFGIYSAVKGW